MKKKRTRRFLASVLSACILASNAWSSAYAFPNRAEAYAEMQTDEAVASVPRMQADGMIPGNAEYLKSNAAMSARSLDYGDTIGSDYVEFAVDSTGRFSIGNRMGRPDTENDDNQILIFGHPYPGTSYTTVFIDGSPNIFVADEVSYDEASMSATATQTIQDIKVTQTLQIVSNAENGEKDTVRISYQAKNTGNAHHTVGFRIMLDTMLGDNDGAPFKVPGIGNIVTEREFIGNEIPRYWQAYDSLTDASVFAVGTFYNNISERPDKVQFAAWPGIVGNAGYYTVTDGCEVTNDSAVAVYWNEKSLYKNAEMEVHTSYGVGYADSSSVNIQEMNIGNDQFGVLVTDVNGQRIAGAAVRLGNRTATTAANGLAVFPMTEAEENASASLEVSKDGYQSVRTTTAAYRGSVASVTLSLPGTESILSVTAEYGGKHTNLLSSYLYFSEYQERDDRDTTNDRTAKLKISANVGREIENASYQIVQGTTIIAEKNVPEFEFDIYEFIDNADSNYHEPAIKDFVKGEDVRLLVFSSGRRVGEKRLGIRIMSPETYHEGLKDFEIEYDNSFTFTVPEDVPVIGDSKIELGTEKIDLPLILAFSENKLKIGLNMPDDTFKKTFLDNNNQKHHFYQAMEKAKQGSYDDLTRFLDKKRLHYGAGIVDGSINICGYGEAAYISDGRYDVALNVVVAGVINGEYTYHTIVVVVPVYVKLEGSASLTVEGSLDFLIHTKPELSIENWTWDLNMKPCFDIKVSGGAGVSGIVSVGAGGQLEMPAEYRMRTKYARVDLKGSVFIEAFLSPWISYRQSWPLATWNLYEGYLGRALEAQAAMNGIYDLDEYSIVEATDEAKYALGNIYDETLINDAVLRGNDVRLVSGSDGSLNAFYFVRGDDASGNDASVIWKKATDSDASENEEHKIVLTASNAALRAADGQTADLYYDVYQDGDRIYMALAKVSERVENPDDIGNLLALSDIYTAEIDARTLEAVNVQRLMDDNAIDVSPKIYHDASGTYTAWVTVQDADNDIFGENAEYVIKLHNSATGGIKEHNIGKNRIYDLAVGKLGQKVVVVYSADTDGNMQTCDDAELFAFDGKTSERLTDNAAADVSPKFAEIGGSQRLFWYCDGAVCERGNTGSGKEAISPEAGVEPEFSVITGNGKTMIVWETLNAGEITTTIYGIDRTDSGWGSRYVLYKGEDYVTSRVSGVIEKNGPSLLHMNTANVFEDENAGTALLLARNITSTNLTLESCTFDPDQAKLGEKLPLKLTIRNNGNTTVEEVAVLVDGEEVSRKKLTMRPGETKELEAKDFILPEISGRTDFQVAAEVCRVKGNYEEEIDFEEIDLNDNSTVVTLGITDLMVDTDMEIINGADYLNVSISNRSYMPSGANLKLLADSKEGVILYEKHLEKVDEYSTEILKFRISDLTGNAQVNCIYAVVTADGDEDMLMNNTSSVNVDDMVNRYHLSVSAGEGGRVEQVSGFYRQGDGISLKAEPFDGWKFAGWEVSPEGVLTDVSKAEISLTMPDADVQAKALFERTEPGQQTAWKLQVTAETGGTVVGNTSGEYKAGDSIHLEAQPYVGYQFAGWICSSDGLITDVNAAAVSFLMPSEHVDVTARFTESATGGRPSGSGGNARSSSGSGSKETTLAGNLTTVDSWLLGGTWENTENGWMLKRTDGEYARRQWAFVNQKWYLFDGNAIMLKGWQLVNGSWYYLDEKNGDMQTGWLLYSGKWYYLDPADGHMRTGWLKVSDQWYYLDEKNGDMKTGWLYLQGSSYYMLPDSGAMVTGWLQIEGTNYYFDENGANAGMSNDIV
jgi:hypothetical protein